MSTLWCCECSATESPRWFGVAEGKWVCDPCAESVRATFALAASLGITGVDLLLKVCET